MARNAFNSVAGRCRSDWKARHRIAALQRLASDVDLFWVVDYPGLATTLRVARASAVRVLYETVDLVPEYPYFGTRRREAALAEERSLIGDIDGFITASDSYADYYMERYGDSVLRRRPVVRDNMPDHIATDIRPATRPLKLLFLGSLMFDRPVGELIEALSLTRADVTLTFQGKNHLGDAPHDLIRELGTADKVRIVDPCPPDAIVKTAARHDIGVVALSGRDENERRASTSKLFTYMAAGLAVLGSDLPGIARVVNEHRNGLLIQKMEPRAWATAIDEIASLPDSEINAMKQRSLDAAHLYSWARQRPSFIAEFVRALGQEPVQRM